MPKTFLTLSLTVFLAGIAASSFAEAQNPTAGHHSGTHNRNDDGKSCCDQRSGDHQAHSQHHSKQPHELHQHADQGATPHHADDSPHGDHHQ